MPRARRAPPPIIDGESAFALSQSVPSLVDARATFGPDPLYERSLVSLGAVSLPPEQANLFYFKPRAPLRFRLEPSTNSIHRPLPRKAAREASTQALWIA